MCRVLLIIIISLSFSINVFAQKNQEGIEESNFAKLSFIVSTPKEQYLKLEPINFELKVVNELEDSVSGGVNFNFSQGYAHLLVTHNGTKRRIEHLSAIQMTDCVVRVGQAEIKTNQEVKSEQTLFYNLEEIFFEQGNYKLQFIVDNRFPRESSSEEIRSNILDIEIVSPTDRDLDAFSFYKDLQGFMQGTFFSNSKTKKIGFQKAIAFMKMFRDTTYFSWVKKHFLEYYQFMRDSDIFSDEDKLFIESLALEPQ